MPDRLLFHERLERFHPRGRLVGHRLGSLEGEAIEHLGGPRLPRLVRRTVPGDGGVELLEDQVTKPKHRRPVTRRLDRFGVRREEPLEGGYRRRCAPVRIGVGGGAPAGVWHPAGDGAVDGAKFLANGAEVGDGYAAEKAALGQGAELKGVHQHVGQLRRRQGVEELPQALDSSVSEECRRREGRHRAGGASPLLWAFALAEHLADRLVRQRHGPRAEALVSWKGVVDRLSSVVRRKEIARAGGMEHGCSCPAGEKFGTTRAAGRGCGSEGPCPTGHAVEEGLPLLFERGGRDAADTDASPVSVRGVPRPGFRGAPGSTHQQRMRFPLVHGPHHSIRVSISRQSNSDASVAWQGDTRPMVCSLRKKFFQISTV